MGYEFQFITLAGFHAQNYAIFDLAKKYKQYGMTAYSRLQQQEFDSEKEGYTATNIKERLEHHILTQYQMLFHLEKVLLQQ